jgi:hypothetical protein
MRRNALRPKGDVASLYFFPYFLADLISFGAVIDAGHRAFYGANLQ